jgi:hypothetical protein
VVWISWWGIQRTPVSSNFSIGYKRVAQDVRLAFVVL